MDKRLATRTWLRVRALIANQFIKLDRTGYIPKNRVLRIIVLGLAILMFVVIPPPLGLIISVAVCCFDKLAYATRMMAEWGLRKYNGNDR